MTTEAITKQLNSLSQEVTMLRSLVISVVGEKDPEGEYRPAFVKRILALAKKKQSGIRFTTPANLYKIISK